MNRNIFDRILRAQERITTDPQEQALWKEHEIVNARFQQQLETMTPVQREAVMSYFGLVIQLHLRTLEAALKEGESD